MKEKLFSVTAKDLVFEYYSGSGKGGSNRNAHQNCVRIKHPPSGAVGRSEDERSLPQNKKKAFVRMYESKEFQKWLKIEITRQTCNLKQVEEIVDKQLE